MSKNIDNKDREVIYLSLHSFNTLLKRLNYVNKKLPKSLSNKLVSRFFGNDTIYLL